MSCVFVQAALAEEGCYLGTVNAEWTGNHAW